MATYEIKNYVKLICIRVDHFESFIVAEKNTNQIDEIEEFINRYDNRDGLKIVIIQMGNMEMISFDDVKKIIKNAHVFDYIRYLSSEGHKMIPFSEINKLDVNWLLKHMLNNNT